MRRRLLFAAGFVFAVCTAYVAGQQKPRVPEDDFAALLKDGIVLSGENVGFQVERAPGETPTAERGYVTGRFVVKVNGRWVEARPAPDAPRIVPVR
jgi:hypothetical protein